MGSTLLFGNGIAMNFAPEEYNYDSLVAKFCRGLSIALDKDHDVDGFVPEVRNFVDSIIDSLSQPNQKFNESIFWDVFLKAIRFKIENFNKVLPTYYKNQNFGSPEELIKYVFSAILNDEVKSNLNIYTSQLFTGAYKILNYGLMHSIAINKNYDGFTKINYSEDFIEFCKSFNNVATTNYYTDLERREINPSYLHGKIFLKNNFHFSDVSENTGKMIGEGNEFQHATEILFGEKYSDKIILNSLLKWNDGDLKRTNILHSQFAEIFKGDVTIIGMSPEADQDLIKFIIQNCKSCHVYFYLDKDEIDWKPFESEKVKLFSAKKELSFIK